MSEEKFSTSDDKLLEELSSVSESMKGLGYFYVANLLIQAPERIKEARAAEHKEWLAHHEREGH